MKTIRTILLMMGLLSCLSTLSSGQDADAKLKAFFEHYLDRVFKQRPFHATQLGEHRYDDQLEDLSADARAGWVELDRRTLAELPQTVDHAALSPAGKIDYEILRDDLQFSLWAAENLRAFETDPRIYNSYINESVYLLLTQSTLPAEKNLANALSRMHRIPQVVAAAKANLRNPPRVHTETAVRQNQGAIGFYERDIYTLINDPAEQAALKKATTPVVACLKDYQKFLEDELLPRATGDWRLGREKFSRKLEFAMNAGVSADEVLAQAESEFTRVESEMYVFAKQLWSRCFPGRILPPDDAEGRHAMIAAVLDTIGQEHGKAEDLIRDARANVADIKKFIREKEILRLPEPDRCEVVEMPEFKRGNSTAYMQWAPPLDSSAASFYAISPPPKDWDAAKVKTLLEEYNTHMLQILTIHEAYPGHYVQGAYASRHPSLIRRVLGSGVYCEGWAVYTEQTMLDQGYGEGNLPLRMSQLKFYLRAVTNAILDHKMQCANMTDEEAMRLLSHAAFQSEGEARLKVIRAKQSACQLSTYFVGRMAMYRLRQQIQRELGDRFKLGDYHEAVLGEGAVPVKYLPALVKERLKVEIAGQRDPKTIPADSKATRDYTIPADRLPQAGKYEVRVQNLRGTHGMDAEIPYPDALERAAVVESKVSDIDREALVLGNGDLSGLLWDCNGVLCLRVTKNDVWDARVETSKDPPILKVDIPNQKWTGGTGSPPSYYHPYPQPRCAAIIRLGADAMAAGWQTIRAEGKAPAMAIVAGMPDAGAKSARLDLRRAVASVNDNTVRTLADRNVFLIETDKEVSLEEIKSPELPAAEQGVASGVKWLHLTMPGDMDYAGMEYALAVASSGKQKAVSLVTSWDTRKNVREEAIRLARETIAEKPEALVAQHEAEWTRYWSASGVELGDGDFQPWWYRMAYFLRCFAKPGAVPAGLWGVLPNDFPKWHGDYHHNYNAWQPYWAPLILNHPELADPWVRYMNEMLPRMRWIAKNTYDCEGGCIGIASFAFEPDPANCKSVNKRQCLIAPYSYTMGMAGMSAQILWYCHLYRPDRQYLEEKIYPVLREVALFYCSFAEKCPRDSSGKAKFGPSYSPEHGRFGVSNVPFDIAYARFTLQAAITAAGELGRDGELSARFRRAIELLPPYPTALDRAGRPIVVDWTGCKFREIDEHNITVPAVPVFPGDQVTWFSPEAERELFRNTLRQTRHRGCNSTVMMSVAKARFSMLDALDDARNYYKPLVQPNGMFYWPMHGYYLSESVGVASMISEFLLQSVDNTIRVFPCWPKEKDAKFTNLRAQGGFLVSAEQKDGKVTKLEITSTVGGKLRLVEPWSGKVTQRETQPGENLLLTEKGTTP